MNRRIGRDGLSQQTLSLCVNVKELSLPSLKACMHESRLCAASEVPKSNQASQERRPELSGPVEN